ncbi:MAG: hypothetical protein ACQEV6_06880 [Pseudomonadota bacterium]
MRLTITLDEEATARYRELASRQTQRELDEDCEPSGPTLVVNISPVFGSSVYLVEGNDQIDLGDASVTLTEKE